MIRVCNQSNDCYVALSVHTSGQHAMVLDSFQPTSLSFEVPDPFTEIYGESSSDGTSLTFFWRKSSEIEQLVLMSVSCPDDDVISCQVQDRPTITHGLRYVVRFRTVKFTHILRGHLTCTRVLTIAQVQVKEHGISWVNCHINPV